ncbi:hypothetical protein Tco_1287355 [Tanacetum coccineum]
MLTAIAGRRYVIGQGLRLAVMKCAESLELRQAFAIVVYTGIAKGFCDGIQHEVEQGKEKLELQDIKAYDPESEGKFVTAMQALKDLKYLLIDELEKLKDAPMDVIMASLYLENDTGEDTPQLIRDLRPTANKSRAEKKKKCRVVCHTHGVGSAHHSRLDRILVSAPTVLQGFQILLQDVTVQTEPTEDGSSPRLIRSKLLPSMYNLDWP